MGKQLVCSGCGSEDIRAEYPEAVWQEALGWYADDHDPDEHAEELEVAEAALAWVNERTVAAAPVEG